MDRINSGMGIRSSDAKIVAYRKKTKKKAWMIAFVSLAVIGAILYGLAQRYLIEHVEISDVRQYENAAGVTQEAQAESTQPQSILFDDWNYMSDDVSITIRQQTIGSGKNMITYYAADVQLSDGTDLQSAFAKNQFGRNIVEDTSVIAEDNDAIFAVNGDYYGFRNDGVIIRNGVIYRDEPARMGLALYQDGTMKIYDETEVSAEELLADGVWNTLSFGPALLIDGAIPADIEDAEVDSNFGNHSIQGNQPRTGIGIIDENHFVFIVVDGRSAGYSVGMTLPDFAQIFQQLGCTQAYNLDGGGSSTMYFMGRVVNNPLGRNEERGVSDILFIG